MMNPTKRKEISHMLKKILCGFLAVAMAATAFAGCSSTAPLLLLAAVRQVPLPRPAVKPAAAKKPI